MLQYIQMRIVLPEDLKKLALFCPSPLYVVGGYVRNFLIDGSISADLDIAAAISAEQIKSAAEKCGLQIVAEYKRTSTLVIFDGKRKYEYTRFRTDVYGKGGKHSPDKSAFTDDITLDALRRDFKCNAIYYDIKNDIICDPLGGTKDIENKVLSTVKDPKDVFCSDGLRLMRLARFAGELGFTPTAGVLESAEKYSENIRDIAPERIYAELKQILAADEKYPFSDKRGHYTGFKILEKIGVLDVLFPEITAGRGMSQRADFHKYDVLEHSLRTLLYAEKDVRLAAFLHDVGKPYCKINFGTYKGHAAEGARITRDILHRLKADSKTIEKTAFLVKWHMFDLKNTEEKSAVRLFIAENRKDFASLIKLKQADYSAGKDDFSVCPTVNKWTEIYGEMKTDGTPFSLKELKISPEELIGIGYTGKRVGEELKNLFKFAVVSPAANDNKALTAKAKEDF